MDFDKILIHQYMLEHSIAAARALEDVEPVKLAVLFNETPNEVLTKVVPRMNPLGMSMVLEQLKDKKVAELFNALENRHIALLIRMINKNLAERILNGLTGEKSNEVKRLLQYLENAVGSYMDSGVFTLNENLTIKEAMAALKKNKNRIQPNLFILNNDRKLVGVISLPDILTGSPGSGLKGLMSSNITSFSPETPLESVLNHPEWQNLYALPVVDSASMFLGVVRLETIRTILINTASKGEEMGQAAVSALGELYRIGLSGIVKSATGFERPPKEM